MQRFLNNWSVLCTAIEAHFGKGTKGDTALPTLPNPHYPSKIANTLATLVKGEVLSPKKFGRLPEELPHQPSPRTNPSKNRTIPLAFRRGASLLLPLHRTSLFPQPLQKDNNPSPHTQPFQIRTIPRKSPTPLPPLSKVRCCHPKKFGRLPEGLSHHPLPFHQPFQNRTIPSAFRRARGLPLPLHRTFPFPQPFQNPHYPTRFSCCEFDSPTSHKIKSAPVFTGANSSSH